MNIFDCTLRDGANVVGCGFSPKLTASMIEALLDCGITQIELGNAKGLGSYAHGAMAPLDDIGYAEVASHYASRGQLGMFMLAGMADAEMLRMLKDNGLSFVRVGMAAGDGAKSLRAIEMVKQAGLICRYSLMKAYIVTAEELAEEASMLARAGVDAVTIMDSAGYMYPKDAAAYVSALKNAVQVLVGFHGHSNLGLSQANALSAVEAGADEIDCGLLGMARSAGNCSTELTVAVMQRLGKLAEVDLFKLLNYEDKVLIPAMTEYGYHAAVSPKDLVLGMTGCHSSFLPLMQSIADDTGCDLYRLIAEVSAVDQKAPTEQLMRKVAYGLVRH